MYIMLWILETMKQTWKHSLSWVFCEPFASLNSSQWQDCTSEPLHLDARGNKPRTLKSTAQNGNLNNCTMYLHFFLFNLGRVERSLKHDFCEEHELYRGRKIDANLKWGKNIWLIWIVESNNGLCAHQWHPWHISLFRLCVIRIT